MQLNSNLTARQYASTPVLSLQDKYQDGARGCLSAKFTKVFLLLLPHLSLCQRDKDPVAASRRVVLSSPHCFLTCFRTCPCPCRTSNRNAASGVGYSNTCITCITAGMFVIPQTNPVDRGVLSVTTKSYTLTNQSRAEKLKARYFFNLSSSSGPKSDSQPHHKTGPPC